jgi:hypothetical protein
MASPDQACVAGVTSWRLNARVSTEPSPPRSRTPEQAAAWAKVEEERRLAAPRGRVGPAPRAVAHLVIGVLVVVAALTTWTVMTPDRYDDRLDVLVLIGLIGGGAALAASVLPRE